VSFYDRYVKKTYHRAPHTASNFAGYAVIGTNGNVVAVFETVTQAYELLDALNDADDPADTLASIFIDRRDEGNPNAPFRDDTWDD